MKVLAYLFLSLKLSVVGGVVGKWGGEEGGDHCSVTASSCAIVMGEPGSMLGELGSNNGGSNPDGTGCV